ncbi:hypothetical protein HK097_001492 [Rhizophlyctis rosea]|uniref:Uncharacterized protein n=1 Tax=Rhizophlyctis rosea TaxID=64517 RepID=A0AAD5SJR5_9FUNG|nr:hypothetical protein HK097_001492 [Rhizophlyctis rosea]
MQKRLKDPTYLPSYGETIHLRGRHAPVRVDVELTELPPPSYDAESTRALDEHVPIWLIEERGENCGLVGVRVVREGEEQEQGGSGSGSSATRVVSAAEIMEGDREVEGREEEERDEMPSVGPSVMEMTNGAELDETMTDDNQSNIPPTLPTVVIRNEEDEIASAHSHMEDDLHDTQLPSISSSSSPGSMEREGTPDQWGPPPSYS